jgi:hypothetical protein
MALRISTHQTRLVLIVVSNVDSPNRWQFHNHHWFTVKQPRSVLNLLPRHFHVRGTFKVLAVLTQNESGAIRKMAPLLTVAHFLQGIYSIMQLMVHRG